MKKFSRKMEEYLLTGKAICAVLWNRTVKIAMPFLICSGAILLIAGLWGAGVAAVRYGLGPPDPATPPIAAFLGLAFLGAVVGFFIFLFLVYFFLIIVLLYEGIPKWTHGMKRKISTLKKEIAETRLELENREEEKSMTKDGSLSLPSENNGALAIANESHGALSLANKENA